MNKERSRGIISDFERRQPGTRGLFIALYAMAALLSVAMLYPFFWVVTGALKEAKEIYAIPPSLFPVQPRWGNFLAAWQSYDLLRTIKNTLVLFGSFLVSKFIVISLAAYALSCLAIPFRKTLFLVFLSTLLLPTVAYLVPSFLVILRVPIIGISLYDNFAAIWAPAGADSFSLLLLKNFFDAIPRELMEASRIDGASEFLILRKVIVPLSKPIFAVLAIFAFLAIWNDFFWTRLVIISPAKWTVSVSLWYRSTVVGAIQPANVQLAATFIAVIPPMILFLLFQKYITQGVTFSGIKG
jgi:multiple sugar transport system permease protein